MKLLRVFSVLAIFILLATSTLPVMAQDEGPKDPNAEVASVETFEVVRKISAKEYQSLHPADSANAVLAAAGCKGYTLGRNGYSADGIHLWSYSWTIDWCYNGSTITVVSPYRSVWVAPGNGWSFLGEAYPPTSSGGVGRTSYSHYGQGQFCWLNIAGCAAYSYPWVNQTVRGNGTYSGSAGGD